VTFDPIHCSSRHSDSGLNSFLCCRASTVAEDFYGNLSFWVLASEKLADALKKLSWHGKLEFHRSKIEVVNAPLRVGPWDFHSFILL
jgi:hypothetical protein